MAAFHCDTASQAQPDSCVRRHHTNMRALPDTTLVALVYGRPLGLRPRALRKLATRVYPVNHSRLSCNIYVYTFHPSLCGTYSVP